MKDYTAQAEELLKQLEFLFEKYSNEPRAMTASFVCYANCSYVWDAPVGGNLRQLILAGKAQPSPF